jgi:hypothetical protein
VFAILIALKGIFILVNLCRIFRYRDQYLKEILSFEF